MIIYQGTHLTRASFGQRRGNTTGMADRALSLMRCASTASAYRVLSVRVSYRSLSTTIPVSSKHPLPPRPTINENDITEAFLKGTGPGGQKINKTSSAVQLKHLPTGVVVKCQETRSRTQNRKIARRILSERLEELEKGSESRTALKVAIKSKKKASKSKKSRRKYRKLAEGKEGEVDEEEDEDVDDDLEEPEPDDSNLSKDDTGCSPADIPAKDGG